MNYRRPQFSLVPAPSGDGGQAPRLSDDDMLAGLRRGEPAVAEAFYWRVRPIVTRTIRRLLGHLDSDAADLTQIAIIQLIEAVPRYRGECPLDAWVSAVSANVIYKHIRRRRLERSRFFEGSTDEDCDVDARVPTPSHTAEARQLAGRVNEHLAAMNVDRAWAFLLHDVCGYSIEEIAHISGVSAAAAQSRLSRGRRELHARIAADPALAELLPRQGGRHV